MITVMLHTHHSAREAYITYMSEATIGLSEATFQAFVSRIRAEYPDFIQNPERKTSFRHKDGRTILIMDALSMVKFYSGDNDLIGRVLYTA